MNEAQQELDFSLEAKADPSTSDQFRRLMEYIRSHCAGKANAKTAREIAEHIGIKTKDPGRAVRKLISIHYGKLPCVICGDASRGFYAAQEAEDATHERRSLYSRLKCLAKRIHDLDRVADRSGFERVGKGASAAYRTRF